MHDQFNIQDLAGEMASVYKLKKELLFCKVMSIEMKGILAFHGYSIEHISIKRNSLMQRSVVGILTGLFKKLQLHNGRMGGRRDS